MTKNLKKALRYLEREEPLLHVSHLFPVNGPKALKIWHKRNKK